MSLKEFVTIPVHLVHLDHASVFNKLQGPGIFRGPGYA